MKNNLTNVLLILICYMFLLYTGTVTAADADKAARKGPLKDLPSPEGPHIAKIKAMGDNSWLDLGVVPPDPEWGEAVGRAWCGTMPFAPDLHGAFLYGEGRHGATTMRTHHHVTE